MSMLLVVGLRRNFLLFGYVLWTAPAFFMDAVADSLPITLSGTTPKKTLTVNTYKPANSSNGIMTLLTYDADQINEGKLVINGNDPIILFGASGVSHNNKRLADITISTPASYWIDGDNTLVFSNIKSAWFSIKEITVIFETSSTTSPEPLAELSINNIDFRTLHVGEISNPVMLTLTNSGAAPLDISNISISTGFTEVNNCSDTVPAGGSCIFDIQFAPATKGNARGRLNINSNASISPVVVSLTGYGVVDTEQDITPITSPTQVDPNAKEVQFYHDFNNEEFHTYTTTDMSTTWRAGSGAGLRTNAVKVVPDPDPSGTHGKVMQVFYAANEYGFNGDSGSQWRTKINGRHDELYFAYDVFFAEDAQFVLGGKLPGLMGGDVMYTGGKKPDGTDGWTGRLMWKTDGKICNYMYHAGQSGKYGQHYFWNGGIEGQVYLERGRWNKLEIRYVMNTPGVTDGHLQAWLNGQLVLDRMDVMYRMPDGEGVGIDRLLFSTFYGGNSAKYAPTTDQYVYYDNFIVSTLPITH